MNHLIYFCTNISLFANDPIVAQCLNILEIDSAKLSGKINDDFNSESQKMINAFVDHPIIYDELMYWLEYKANDVILTNKISEFITDISNLQTKYVISGTSKECILIACKINFMVNHKLVQKEDVQIIIYGMLANKTKQIINLFGLMDQTNLISNKLINYQKPRLIENKHGLLVYKDSLFYSKLDADQIFTELNANIEYNKDSSIKILGKIIPIPRKQTAYGDEGTGYSFSGTHVAAKPWIPILSKIRDDIELTTGRKFNFCLVNYYANGDHYIGYHKDDERELIPGNKYVFADEDAEPIDSDIMIASVSFGQERNFYFKHDLNSIPVVKTKLGHGCLCIMIGTTNKFWKHSVPKEKGITKPRLNLTFRYIYVK
jgi:DNA oxidative demethylase